MATASRFLEIASRAGPQAFHVQRLQGQESLNGLFEYQLDLLCEHADVAASLLLGSNATVALERPGEAEPRYFNGYFTRFVARGALRTPAFPSGRCFLYQATLHPGLWFFTRRIGSRIFHRLSIGDLLCRQLAADPLIHLRPQLGPTEFRDYVVQYRESDFQFINRLAEHAGLSYAFVHENGRHTLVLTDRAETLADAVMPATLVADADAEESAAGPPSALTLRRFELASCVQSGHYAGVDLDAEVSGAAIFASARRPAGHDNDANEVFEHPIPASRRDAAEHAARLRAEELACGHQVGHGEGRHRGLRPGARLRLDGHPIPALNRDYLVLRHQFDVRNNATQTALDTSARFECRFDAIPADVVFRPPRSTPRPQVLGTQPARVVADCRQDAPAASATTATPPVGRVKVAFYWDREGRSSCWLRVAHPAAGKGRGLQSLPRIGDEVLVAFVDGDPDRPIIVGHVHGAENPPPYALPAQRAVSGWKTQSVDDAGAGVAGRFNEWRFDDRAGAEQVHLRAQRDLEWRALHDHRGWVGHEMHLRVDADRRVDCRGDDHLRVAGDCNLQLGGSLSLGAGQDVLVRAPQGRAACEAGQEIHLRAGGTVVIEAGARISLRCGGSFIDINPAGVFLVGPQVRANAGGAAGQGQGAAGEPALAAQVAGDDAVAPAPAASARADAPPPAPSRPSRFAVAARTAAATGQPFCRWCDGCDRGCSDAGGSPA